MKYNTFNGDFMNEKKTVLEIRNNAILKLPYLFDIIYNNINIENIVLCKFRIKDINSYLDRMKRLKCEIDKVDDLIGFCIVVKTNNECYKLLEKIESIKEFKINKIRDYIKKPCGINKYEAIHIKFEWNNCFCEIQIKTKKMYYNAESTYYLYKRKD